LQDFFRVELGYEHEANLVVVRACQKMVKDMHCEVRIQTIIQYYAEFKHIKIKKSCSTIDETD
jgi:hypothetical protein